MAFFIVVMGIELILLALTAPVSIRVGIYFSLNAEKSFINVKILGVNAIRLKLENTGGVIRVTLNGKNLKKRADKKSRVSAKKIAAVMTRIRAGNIIRGFYAAALVGGEDAGAAAINYSLMKLAVTALGGRAAVYPDPDGERLNFDARIKCRLSVLQAAGLALAK